jgi:membrane fusion protein (multidrug efflux system)
MSQTATAPGTGPRVLPTDTPLQREARSKLLRPLLMLGGVLVVAVGSFMFWLQGGRFISIDNAYVRAAKLAVATDIAGIVAEVAVKEGQRVKKGDLLFRLEPAHYQNILAGAEANLAQTALSMEAMKRDYQRMLRDIDTKLAVVQSDQASFDRFANLVKGGGVTRAEYDDARFRLAANQAAVASLRVLAEVQLARLGGNPDIDVRLTPQYLQAKAQVDEARRQLAHTQVYAPFNGVATQVETMQPGMYLAAATAGIGLVSSERFWIDASPKETDLTFVKPGDHVDFTVDTYPGRIWKGKVESIAPASGAEFSILPAQNASGNWVKVVQRNPIRIAVEPRSDDPPLRAGMSVVVDIDTGHIRHWRDLMP